MTYSRFVFLVPCLFASLLLVSGCSKGVSRGPYSGGESVVVRDIQGSKELYGQAHVVLHSDPSTAERLLRNALDLDLYNGPAHNNLGVLLLNRGLLYDAAQEFEWARKLLPGHPDPRTNLAIALFSAGKSSDAIETVMTALEIEPHNLDALETIAYIQFESGNVDARTVGYLALIRERSTDDVWKSWAIETQMKIQSQTP